MTYVIPPWMTSATPGRSLAAYLKIPPAARASWAALWATITVAAEDVPCTGESGPLWTSEDPAHRIAAAQRCAGCPAIVACDQYAAAARETVGVYAGVDRTARGRAG